MFTFILAITAFLVAGCAAYFSVLGIATLFSGHYLQVLIMAGSLEIGKLVATSFLYRYWNKTIWFLKLYFIIAILTLMAITSLGIYGYLSSGFQVNAGKLEAIEKQVSLIEEQKNNISKEIEQNNKRVNTLNEARKSQEERLPKMSRESAKPVYEDMARAAKEIENFNTRNQSLQDSLTSKDSEILELQKQNNEVHDIGTFKFVADSLNLPLETIVKFFIIIIVCVFDPLAVSLVLAYNIASRGSILKEEKIEKKQTEEPVIESKPSFVAAGRINNKK
jgi:uncharacterized membrane protein (DUF106 family)